MQVFWREHVFFAGMAVVLLLLSILCRFFTGMQLKRMLRETENMSVTGNRTLKQCKLKFQNYYELNAGNMNVEVFVEKFMQGIRIGRCSLRMLNLLSGQLLLLSIFADGAGICMGIIYGETLGQVLPFYLLAFLSLYFYFSVSGLVDVQGKQKALQTSVMDFLENRMTERIRGVKRDSAYLEAEEQKGKAKTKGAQAAGKRTEATAGKAQAEGKAKAAATVAEAFGKDGKKTPESELEQLLHEFLA